MKLLQLVQRYPDQVIVDGLAQLLLEQQANLARRALAVAVLPDQRRRPVEAVRLISLKVIDENFIRQFSNNSGFPGVRQVCFP
jgi:hypothetical protein